MPKLLIRKQEGAAAIGGVLLALISMTMISFFASRSMIFEQKMSANNVRYTAASQAADAGLEWAIANLNLSQPLNNSCLISTTGNNKSFRSKYLDPNNTDLFAGPFSSSNPTCTNNSGVLTCYCPSSGQAAFPVSATPAFSISFNQVPGDPSLVEVVSTGCNSASAPCNSSTSVKADSIAIVKQIIKYSSSLATAPAAALTAGGNIDFGSNAINVTNNDPGTNGITLNSGGTITGFVSSNTINTVPGTPVEASLIPNDRTLQTTDSTEFFRKFFGTSEEGFKNSPATTQMTPGNNSEASLLALINSGANTIYVNGNLSLSGNGVYGSPSRPVMLVVNGDMHVNGNVVIYGLVYTNATAWDNRGGGNASIIGAAIARGDFTATGSPNPTYDAKVLGSLRSQSGVYARVIGSWRDF